MGVGVSVGDCSILIAARLAASRRHFKLLEILVNSGADPSPSDAAGDSVLHILAQQKSNSGPWGSLGVPMLFRSANDIFQDCSDRTSICSMVAMREFEGFSPEELRLEHYTSHSADDGDDTGPDCADDGSGVDGIDGIQTAVMRLIDVRADVNKANNASCTPLHYALGRCSEPQIDAVVQALLASGGDLNAKDSVGNSPIHALLQQPDLSNEQLHALTSVIKSDVDLNVADGNGCPILHLVAINGVLNRDLDCFNTVLGCGADVNAVDRGGNTALHKVLDDVHRSLLSENGNGPPTETLQPLHSDKHSLTVASSKTDEARDDQKYSAEKMRLQYNKQRPGQCGTGLDSCDDLNSVEFSLSLDFKPRSLASCLLEVISQLIERGIDLSRVNKNGQAAIHAAVILCVRLGDFTAMKMLCDAGCNMEVQDAAGNTPLHLLLGQIESTPTTRTLATVADPVMEILVAVGSSLALKSSTGETPLTAAAALGPTHIDILLAIAQASQAVNPEVINDSNGLGNSALHVVAGWKSDTTRAIEGLLACGANIDQQNDAGQTAACIAAGNAGLAIPGEAAEHAWRTLTTLMDAGVDLNIADEKGNAALHYLVQNRKLCGNQHHIVVNVGDSESASSESHSDQVSRPTLYGNVNRARVLVDAGADVNAKNSDGQNAFWFAASTSLFLFDLLLHKGDVDAIDAHGDTVLQILLRSHRAPTPLLCSVVVRLIESGVDLHNKNDEGLCAVMEAAKAGINDANFTMMSLLLDAGADVNATDVNGTPLIFQLLSMDYQSETLKPLATVPVFPSEAAWRMVESLVARNADLDALNASGYTLTMVACLIGCAPLLTLLLNNGADVNIPTPDGLMPLCVYISRAVSSVHDAETLCTIQKLVEAGANLGSFGTKAQHSPLGLAVIADILHSDSDLVRYLIANGADPNWLLWRDNSSVSLVGFYAELGDVGMVQWLLDHGASPNGASDELSIPGRTRDSFVTQLSRQDMRAFDCVDTPTGPIVAAVHTDASIPKHLCAVVPGMKIAPVCEAAISECRKPATDERTQTADPQEAVVSFSSDGFLLSRSSSCVPVAAAAGFGHDEIVRVLAKSGADLNIGDAAGVLPLQRYLQGWAELVKNQRMIKFLVAHGADPNVLCRSVQPRPGPEKYPGPSTGRVIRVSGAGGSPAAELCNGLYMARY